MLQCTYEDMQKEGCSSGTGSPNQKLFLSLLSGEFVEELGGEPDCSKGFQGADKGVERISQEKTTIDIPLKPKGANGKLPPAL